MIVFLLKLSLCWGFFALLYAGLLRYETFFRANRLYLLSTFILGIVLAALPGEQILEPVYGAEESGLMLPVFTLNLDQVAVATNQWENTDYLWLIYWLGFSVMAIRLIWGLLKLARMIRSGQRKQLSDGSHIVQSGEAQTPFSFFHWIFKLPYLEGV